MSDCRAKWDLPLPSVMSRGMICLSSAQGEVQSHQVRFLLNMCHFHTIVKSKTSKSDCRKSGAPCARIEGGSAHLLRDLSCSLLIRHLLRKRGPGEQITGAQQLLKCPPPHLLKWVLRGRVGNRAERGTETRMPRAHMLCMRCLYLLLAMPIGMQKFPGQESNPRHSGNQSHYSDP